MSLILPLLLLFRVTFFHDTGHTMANGQMPFPGAAACSSDFPIGTVIGLSGKSGWLDVVCLDRGHLNSRHWVDIYAESPERGAVIARNFSPYAYGVVVRE
jgi:hypothetical protein